MNNLILVGPLIGAIIGLVGALVFFIIRKLEGLAKEMSAIRSGLVGIPFQNELGAKGRIATDLRPLPAILIRDTEFQTKYYYKRPDKTAISSFVAQEVHDGNTIIVDSGSTIDEVPGMLRKAEKRVTTYTNSILAAVSAFPPAPESKCFLLPGWLDRRYFAVYDIKRAEEVIADEKLLVHYVLLAATAVSFQKGPMVSAGDSPNRFYKSVLVKKALLTTDCRLIIAADWTKFTERRSVVSPMTGKPIQLNEVLTNEQDWRDVKSRNDFVIVTVPPPDSLDSPDAEMARGVLKEFMKNETGSNGMRVRLLPGEEQPNSCA
jgi:DeoR/GlpR family transcriptional regulator of sugar metabolism